MNWNPFMFLRIAACVAAAAVVLSAAGPSRVLESNPRWLTDGSSRAGYLTGSHGWQNLQDDGHRLPEGQDAPPAFDFEDYLSFLERRSHNLIRLWRW